MLSAQNQTNLKIIPDFLTLNGMICSHYLLSDVSAWWHFLEYKRNGHHTEIRSPHSYLWFIRCSRVIVFHVIFEVFTAVTMKNAVF
jgi:hypothetical protein